MHYTILLIKTMGKSETETSPPGITLVLNNLPLYDQNHNPSPIILMYEKQNKKDYKKSLKIT